MTADGANTEDVCLSLQTEGTPRMSTCDRRRREHRGCLSVTAGGGNTDDVDLSLQMDGTPRMSTCDRRRREHRGCRPMTAD